MKSNTTAALDLQLDKVLPLPVHHEKFYFELTWNTPRVIKTTLFNSGHTEGDKNDTN